MIIIIKLWSIVEYQVKILENFVAFSEYMNFKHVHLILGMNFVFFCHARSNLSITNDLTSVMKIELDVYWGWFFHFCFISLFAYMKYSKIICDHMVPIYVKSNQYMA